MYQYKGGRHVPQSKIPIFLKGIKSIMEFWGSVIIDEYVIYSTWSKINTYKSIKQFVL